MQTISCHRLTGERALFKARDLSIENCVFEDGESPLKEARDLTVTDCVFRWKYPFWYGTSITVRHSLLLEMARAGMWYDTDLAFEATSASPTSGVRSRRLTKPGYQVLGLATRYVSNASVRMRAFRQNKPASE